MKHFRLFVLVVLLLLSIRAVAQVSADVYLMKSNGTDVRQVTQLSAFNINRVRFSPDGSKLVFDVIKGTHGTVFIANSDGTGARPVDDASESFFPVFTPDGQNILFTALDNASGKEAVYTMNISGAGKTIVKQNASEAEISADGSQILFCRKVDGDDLIFTSHADGTGEMQIPKHSGCKRPSFNPQNSSEILDFTYSSVLTFKTDGSAETVIRSDRSIFSEPNYSPDGRSIVFAGSTLYTLDIYTMKHDGTGLVQLTNSDGHINFIEPAFSPDGKIIAFVGRTKFSTKQE